MLHSKNDDYEAGNQKYVLLSRPRVTLNFFIQGLVNFLNLLACQNITGPKLPHTICVLLIIVSLNLVTDNIGASTVHFKITF